MERSTMLLMGKSTISTGPFSSSQTVNVYQRVPGCSDFLMFLALKECGKSMRFLDDFWMIFGDPVFRYVQIKPIVWAFCKFPPVGHDRFMFFGMHYSFQMPK